ncbi:MAG: hypothetical protein HY902_13570 [Deltaproteobacteria bacterium]|nr:hypothetical protein [Deltaproteobacteria bacterium]
MVLLAQELLLLEGHLADPERRCPSCVTKHALTVRALADEGRRLDGGGGLAQVWAEASALALSGDVQAVRGLRQDVVGVVVGQSGAAEPFGASGQAGGRAGTVGIPWPRAPASGSEASAQSGYDSSGFPRAKPDPLPVSVPGKGIGPDSWWTKLYCKNACAGKECGPSLNPFCSCGKCGTSSSGNPKVCKAGKCCGKFECCNCTKPSGAKPNEEGEYWGCDKAAKRCICLNVNEKDPNVDNCLAGDGCSCPTGHFCTQFCRTKTLQKKYPKYDPGWYMFGQCSDQGYKNLLAEKPYFEGKGLTFLVEKIGVCLPGQEKLPTT